MHRWLLPPLPQRDTDESTLLAAQNRSTRDPDRLFRRAESPAASVCLSLVCSSVASGRSSEEKEKKKTPSLLLLNNLSIKTKPEQQPRAGRLFCLMLNIPRPGQHAPECWERVQGPRVGSVVGAGLVRKGPAQPPAPGPAQPRDGGRWGKTSAAPLCTAILLSSAACRELPFPPSTSVHQTKPNQTPTQLQPSPVNQGLTQPLVAMLMGPPAQALFSPCGKYFKLPLLPLHICFGAPGSCPGTDHSQRQAFSRCSAHPRDPGRSQQGYRQWVSDQPHPWRSYRLCPNTLMASGSRRERNKSGHGQDPHQEKGYLGYSVPKASPQEAATRATGSL